MTSFQPEIEASPFVARIAIVDDKRELLSLYSRVISRLGYPTPATFTNGTSLVKAIVSDRISFDVILMDYRLPEMDGIDAARIIRRYRPNTRIILATAYDSTKARALDSGLLFLQKPFSAKELSIILRRALTQI